MRACWRGRDTPESRPRHFLGALAGLLAQTAVYPLDVVRRRMQMHDGKTALYPRSGIRVFMCPNQRPRGHVLRRIRPYSAVFTVFFSVVFTRCSEDTARYRRPAP